MSTPITEIRTPHGLLDAKVKTTYHVDWLTYAHVRDRGAMGLEGVFKAAYGKSMEMLESPNDTDYSFDVKKEAISEYDQACLSECINNGSFENYYLRLLLQDLANKNVLPAGHYVVTVSW